MNLPTWVHLAAERPVAFAQVREDPRIDRWLAEDCAREAGSAISLIQIASGGCTAALLATLPQVAHLHLVDPNPAQLALTRLKLWLLGQRTPAERMVLLGHAPMPTAERAAALRAAFAAALLPMDCLGPLAEVAAVGPDQAGRYEQVFAALRRHLAPLAAEVAGLLALDDVAEQRRRTAPGSALGDGIDAAFTEAMALPILVHLFGEGATRNAAMPFAEHFAARLRHALATLPAADNPFVWQLLSGTYPPSHPADWLTQATPARLPGIHWSPMTMDAALAGAAGRYHLVHLSNILDWLTPEAAARTLDLAWQALRPGGRVVIRQLNSSLVIPSLAPRFSWSAAAAAQHANDRSFFYRALHLGRKA